MCHIHPIIHHQQITVMKRIILILGLAASIGLMGTGSVHAQFVVHDPGHTLLNSTEWIANVKKWVTQINEMIDAQELRLGLQKIDQLKELKSLKELADLLDDVACLSSDYSFSCGYRPASKKRPALSGRPLCVNLLSSILLAAAV